MHHDTDITMMMVGTDGKAEPEFTLPPKAEDADLEGVH